MVRLLIIFVMCVSGFASHAKKLSQSKTKNYSYVLNDPDNKIRKEFKVHSDIKQRVNFWFNIYSQYTSKHEALHHTQYPWVTYEIIDTTNIYNTYKNEKIAKKKARAFISKRKKHYKKIINKLSRLNKYNKLNKEELAVLNKIKTIGKNLKKELRLAGKKIRAQHGLKDHFITGLANSHKYQPYIDDIFKSKNLPIEIGALPMVESNFNVTAFSKVGASGIWQIMKPTGKQYGIVNNTIDERNSPFKATLMAAKLMKFNYGQFKNWPLAITAYNNGAGNLRRAMKRANTKNPYTLINNHKRGAFGFASSNFYASFVAALYAKTYSNKIFNYKEVKPDQLEKVKFKRATTLRHIVRKTGQSLKSIKNINLDLGKKISLSTRLPKNFTLYLPKGSSKQLMNKTTFLVDFTGKKLNAKRGS